MEKASVIFLAFLQRNGMVAVVILAVFAVRALLRKCPKKYSYALWAIVGIRMLFDLPIASGWSLFNLFCLVKSRSQMSEIAHYTGASFGDAAVFYRYRAGPLAYQDHDL